MARQDRLTTARAPPAQAVLLDTRVSNLGIDPESGRILGAGITEMVVATEAGFTAGDLDLTIHPHPTLPETLMEAAAAWFGAAAHVYRPKKR